MHTRQSSKVYIYIYLSHIEGNLSKEHALVLFLWHVTGRASLTMQRQIQYSSKNLGAMHHHYEADQWICVVYLMQLKARTWNFSSVESLQKIQLKPWYFNNTWKRSHAFLSLSSNSKELLHSASCFGSQYIWSPKNFLYMTVLYCLRLT